MAPILPELSPSMGILIPQTPPMQRTSSAKYWCSTAAPIPMSRPSNWLPSKRKWPMPESIGK